MTKKIFFGLAVASMFAACTDDFKDWADPIVNAQTNGIDGDEVSMAVRAGISQAVSEFNLGAATTESIKLFNLSLPENTTFSSFDLAFENLDNGNQYVVPVASDGTASVADLNTAITSIFGRAPQLNEVSGHPVITVSVIGETGSVPLEVPVNMVVFNAQPISPDVETAYSLVLNGQETALNHSSINVWDDPVFTLTFDANEGDEWSIVSASGKTYGFDIPGDTTPDGTMKANGENGAIEEGGKHKLTFNAETLEYSVVLALYPDFLYIPGNGQGWSPETAPALAHKGDGLYTGFAWQDGMFKFLEERNWSATQYNVTSFSTCSEGFELAPNNDNNITNTVAGVYYFEVNIATGDLKATLINNMNLVGDFNGWNAADDAQQMTWNADELCFVMEAPAVTAAGWKFTANNDWTINLGGTYDNLVQDGANLNMTGEIIKLYPCRTNSENIYCKFGDDPLPTFPDFIYAPGNAQGWAPATAPALKHQGGGLFTGFAYMDGEFKFTQERAWAAEYNNSSFSTASENFNLGNKDGGNINCSVAGVYYFEVNVATGDLKATLINNMNLVGDFNGWNAADDSQKMTWNAADLCYEITGASVNSNGWKFTANNDWGINLGGSLTDLSQNGSDLKDTGSTIKLYPCRTTAETIYCTVE